MRTSLKDSSSSGSLLEERKMKSATREFASEHHDWDLTMRASSDLLTIGEKIKQPSLSFAGLVGSMLLSITALESFLNSFAYKVSEKEKSFCWECFEKKSIETKLEFLLKHYSQDVDKGKRPLQTIKRAITWRNSLVHSKPSFIDPARIDLNSDVKKLAKRYVSKNQYEPYETLVNQEWAKKFNNDVISIIKILKNVSGIDPRAQCSYKVL